MASTPSAIGALMLYESASTYLKRRRNPAAPRGKLGTLAYALPTNKTVPPPAGFPNVEIFIPDWANVSAKRKEWVERWDKDMAV